MEHTTSPSSRMSHDGHLARLESSLSWSSIGHDGPISALSDDPSRAYDDEVIAEADEVQQYKGLRGLVKGIGYKGDEEEWFGKRLIWLRTDDKWAGEWIWVEYDRESWWDYLDGHMRCDTAGVERAIANSDGGTIPAEVFQWVLKRFLTFSIPAPLDDTRDIGSWQLTDWERWMDQNTHTLSQFSLVCRTWRDTCAPLLYSRIFINNERINELLPSLRAPSSQLRQHARLVTLRGQDDSWTTFAKLTRLLPHATIARCEPLNSASVRALAANLHPRYTAVVKAILQ